MYLSILKWERERAEAVDCDGSQLLFARAFALRARAVVLISTGFRLDYYVDHDIREKMKRRLRIIE